MEINIPLSNLQINKLTPNIGAEIICKNVFENLSSKICDEIYKYLIEYKVIFFRDQNISPTQHINFAKSFGDIDPGHPVYPHVEGFQSIVLLKNDANSKPDTNDWHKDFTFKSNPPFASILHGVSVPKVGGDTLWASMSAAYEGLPEGWKEDLDGLEAIHDMGTFRNDFYREGGVDSVNSALKKVGSAVHKVIETHPISGLKYLNVNQSFTRNIVNDSQGKSDPILQFLFQHITKPEFQVRFHWQNNSIAIWDNRITQHYAVCDYLPQSRHMQRVTVINDKRDRS